MVTSRRIVMNQEIVLITSNQNKLREFQEILGKPIQSASLEIDEIQDIAGEKVVKDKAKKAYAQIKKPVIVDDTGIFLEALNGFPGVLSTWIEKTCGFKILCDLAHLYQNNQALAKTFIGFFDGKKYNGFIGEANGRIAEKPQGEKGFGFDAIFIPEGFEKTQAEMKAQEKNQISSRRRALEQLKEFLEVQER